jgi:hypothetical protein
MSFITFMIGQNLTAFEQWKQLFCLMTYAKDGIHPDVDTMLENGKSEEKIEA